MEQININIDRDKIKKILSTKTINIDLTNYPEFFTYENINWFKYTNSVVKKLFTDYFVDKINLNINELTYKDLLINKSTVSIQDTYDIPNLINNSFELNKFKFKIELSFDYDITKINLKNSFKLIDIKTLLSSNEFKNFIINKYNKGEYLQLIIKRYLEYFNSISRKFIDLVIKINYILSVDEFKKLFYEKTGTRGIYTCKLREKNIIYILTNKNLIKINNVLLENINNKEQLLQFFNIQETININTRSKINRKSKK